MFLLAIGMVVPAGPQPALAVGAQAIAAAPTALEQFFNPFGDAWELKRPANPDVPVSLTPACHRIEPARSTGPTSDQIQWLSKSNSRILFEECAELADITDGQGAALLKTFVTALKAADPTVKFLGHYTAGILPTAPVSSSAAVNDGEPIGMRYIDQNQEGWFVHQKGRPPLREYRLRHASSFAEILDITNPSLRDFLATSLAQSMTFHGVDGVAIDSCHDLPQFNPSIPGNVPPDEIMSNWANGCVAFMQDLKARAPSRLVFTLNYWSLAGQQSGNHEVYDQEWFNRRIAVADGLLWEDPIGQYLYSADETQTSIERLAARIAQARALDKYLGVLVNTNIGNQSTFRTTNATQQQAYANYYFAAYLMAFETPKTLLIAYTPTEAVDQFNSAAFFRIWDADVGPPVGPRQNLAQGVYSRNFQRGRAVFNGSFSPVEVSLEDGYFLTWDGAPIRTATIPAKSGGVFVSALSSPACNPRPAVRLQTRALPGGSVEVTITGGLGDVRRLDVGRAPNTLITVQGGPQRVDGNRSIDMPNGSRTAVLTLDRAAAGGGVFAQLNVVDNCGVWRTFAGRGTG
jgi:hypothetical protein